MSDLIPGRIVHLVPAYGERRAGRVEVVHDAEAGIVDISAVEPESPSATGKVVPAKTKIYREVVYQNGDADGNGYRWCWPRD